MLDKDLLRLLGEEKKYISRVVGLMLLGLISNITITGAICCAVYLAAGVPGVEPVWFCLPALAAGSGAAVRYITTRTVGDLKDRIGRGAKRDLREKVYAKILRLGVRDTDDMSMAGLTQVALEGVEQLDLYYSSYVPQFFYALLAPVLLFGITVWLDWRVALVLLSAVPLIPLSIVAVSRYAKRIFAKYWGRYTGMGDSFLDSVQGLRELKIFDADAAQHRKMNASAEEFRRITMKVLVMQLASTTIMDLVAYGGAGMGIAVAVMGIANRSLDPFAALFLTLVAADFFLPLRSFGSAFHIAMNGVSAGKKILDLLEQPDPVWGSDAPTDTHLQLQDIRFSYDGKRNVLDGLSLHCPAVGMTAIVGESGCGKSTVVGLLSGSLRPDTGTVSMGDRSLDTLRRESCYARLAVVSCGTYIFNESVRANFALAKSNVDDREIWNALEQVNLAAFIRENGGLDKPIAEDAVNISGGQRQRLALAVGLMADKDIYIFDEATSNIDIESEAIIMNTLRRLAQQKAVVVISHRLANVVLADHIWFLQNGRVAEHGTHTELMKQAGGYAHLFQTQKTLENGYTEVFA